MYPDYLPAPNAPIMPLFLLLELPERASDREAARNQVNRVLEHIKTCLNITRDTPVYIWLHVFGHKACGGYMGFYEISERITGFLDGNNNVSLEDGLIRLDTSLTEELEFNARYPFFRPTILLFCSGETAANMPDELEYLRENPWFVQSSRWILTREPLLNTASAKRFVGPGPRFGLGRPNIIDFPLHQAPLFVLGPLVNALRLEGTSRIFRPQMPADFVRADPVIPDWDGISDHPGYIIEPEFDVPLVPPKDPVDGYISADDAFIPDFAPPEDGGTGFFIPLGPDETDTTEEQGNNGIDNGFFHFFGDL